MCFRPAAEEPAAGEAHRVPEPTPRVDVGRADRSGKRAARLAELSSRRDGTLARETLGRAMLLDRSAAFANLVPRNIPARRSGADL